MSKTQNVCFKNDRNALCETPVILKAKWEGSLGWEKKKRSGHRISLKQVFVGREKIYFMNEGGKYFFKELEKAGKFVA